MAKANGELPQIILEESHADGQWVVTRSVISNKNLYKSSEELRKIKRI